jgi:magnesium transporter
VLKNYDDAINSMRFLVYFIPLIISSGGNSGSQAASLIIRSLAVKEIEGYQWRKIFAREFAMSLALGVVLGAVGYVRAITWGQSHTVGLTIFLSLVGVVSFGATLGAMFPLLLQSLKFDPAVSSSPFIASIVDVVGLIILMEVAISVAMMFG